MEKNNDSLIVLEEVKYPVSIEDIKAFNEKWAEVPELEATAGTKDPKYIEIKKAHLEAVKFRTTIEKRRKILKEPVLQYSRAVDAVAKELQATINPKEIELFAERNKVEEYQKCMEEEKARAEIERVRRIDEEIFKLKMIPSDAVGKTHSELLEIYNDIVIPDPLMFEEKIDDAISVYKDTMHKLETMIEQAKNAEEVEKIRAEEKARRDAEDAERRAKEEEERRKFEEEKRAFQEEKRKLEAEKRKLEAEKQAKEEEERRKAVELEAELMAKEEEEAKAKEQAVAEKTIKKIENKAIGVIAEIVADNMVPGQCAEMVLGAIIADKVPGVKWAYSE